jgi:tight adherence protein C
VTGLVLLVGAVAGLGLWLLMLGVRPRPPRLDRALDTLAQEPEPPEQMSGAGWAAQIGLPAVRLLRRFGLPTGTTRANLAIIGKPVTVHLAEQAATTTAGLLFPPLASAILTIGGSDTGIVFPAAVSLLGAVAGWWVPELSAASAAREYQAAFRHALGSFLDLVVIATAGGAGVDQALDDAAQVGHGPAYAELRYALAEARLARIPPWDTLGRLGARVGVPELEQLAATIGLAGSEGAKIRASLQSRAATMRTRQITDVEGRAASATERMSLPIVILFGAFFVLIGFPALSTILGSL